MTDDTQQITRTTTQASGGESYFKGVSTRGWIVICVVLTACAHELSIIAFCLFTGTQIPKTEEPFYSLLVLVVGYYFGQKNQGTTNSQTTTTTPT